MPNVNVRAMLGTGDKIMSCSELLSGSDCWFLHSQILGVFLILHLENLEIHPVSEY